MIGQLVLLGAPGLDALRVLRILAFPLQRGHMENLLLDRALDELRFFSRDKRLGRLEYLFRVDRDDRLSAPRTFLRLNPQRIVGFADRGFAPVPQLYQGLGMLTHRPADLVDDSLMLS